MKLEIASIGLQRTPSPAIGRERWVGRKLTHVRPVPAANVSPRLDVCVEGSTLGFQVLKLCRVRRRQRHLGPPQRRRARHTRAGAAASRRRTPAPSGASRRRAAAPSAADAARSAPHPLRQIHADSASAASRWGPRLASHKLNADCGGEVSAQLTNRRSTGLCGCSGCYAGHAQRPCVACANSVCVVQCSSVAKACRRHALRPCSAGAAQTSANGRHISAQIAARTLQWHRHAVAIPSTLSLPSSYIL